MWRLVTAFLAIGICTSAWAVDATSLGQLSARLAEPAQGNATSGYKGEYTQWAYALGGSTPCEGSPCRRMTYTWVKAGPREQGECMFMCLPGQTPPMTVSVKFLTIQYDCDVDVHVLGMDIDLPQCGYRKITLSGPAGGTTDHSYHNKAATNQYRLTYPLPVKPIPKFTLPPGVEPCRYEHCILFYQTGSVYDGFQIRLFE